MKVINFDTLFERYLSAWYKRNKDEFKDYEEMENKMPEVYATFCDAKLPELNGKSPREFFAEVTSAEELVNALQEYIDRGIPVSDVHFDAIVDRKECEQPLYQLLCSSRSEEVVMMAANLLNELQSSLPLEKYVDDLISGKMGANYLELATEILGNYSDLVKEKILSVYDKTNGDVQAAFLNILVNSKGDDRIFTRILSAFQAADDVALTAAYFGKYGDERALPFLREKIESEEINYVEFTELKNAIEELGGTVLIEKDFSHDEDYLAMQHVMQ